MKRIVRKWEFGFSARVGINEIIRLFSHFGSMN
jgi:hypothetical protein